MSSDIAEQKKLDDAQLTEHLGKFVAEWGKDTLGNFKDAQI